jgi:hypothetical protein
VVLIKSSSPAPLHFAFALLSFLFVINSQPKVKSPK